MKVLNGQTAIVTGAGRGIGRQIAVELAAAGASVALVARTREQLENATQEIEAAGGTAMAVPIDVTNRAAVEAAVARIRQTLGEITFLVNNAGADKPYGPIGVVDPDEWWEALNLHVRGALLFMHACLPAMQATGNARIVNMASMAGVKIGPGTSAYCVGKATLIRLSEHVAAENVDKGVRVFTGHPGTIVTDMLLNSLDNPQAIKHASAMINFLRTFADKDTSHELRRLCAQMVKIAAGEMDSEAGRFIDFEQECRPEAFGPAPPPTAHEG